MKNPDQTHEPRKLTEALSPHDLTKEELTALGRVAGIAHAYATGQTDAITPSLPDAVDSKYATSNLGLVLSDTEPAVVDRAAYAEHVQNVSDQATTAAILQFTHPDSR